MFRGFIRRSDRADRTRSRIEHWLLLLISPFLVSLIANIAVLVWTNTQVSFGLWLLLFLSFVVWIASYMAAFTAAFQTPILWWTHIRRCRRFMKPYVAVLDGRIADDGIALISPIYTVHTPDEWCQEIRNQNPSWQVELLSMDRALSDSVDMVVNPFGEAYPEEDLSFHTTFSRIRDYVKGGGVYVNVAGYPFWWKTNPITGEKTPAGRWEQQEQSDIMFNKPLIPDLLGISPVFPGSPQSGLTRQEQRDVQRFGEIAGAGGGNDACIFRPYPSTSQRIIPLLRTDSGQEIVIGAVPFGAGYFIFAGLEIDRVSRSFAKALAAVCGWVKYERDGRQ